MQCLVGSSRASDQETMQNLKRRRIFARCGLMICSSPNQDKHFHEQSSQSFQSMDLVLFGHQFRMYFEHLFHYEAFCIFDGMSIIWVILSQKTPLIPMLKTWTFVHITKWFSPSFTHSFFEDRVCFLVLNHSTCVNRNDQNPNDKAILLRRLQWSLTEIRTDFFWKLHFLTCDNKPLQLATFATLTVGDRPLMSLCHNTMTSGWSTPTNTTI